MTIVDSLRGIEGLAESSEQQYSQNGIHWQHMAASGAMPAAARAFFDAGYYLEMLTCLDFTEKEGKFRVVYQFNCPGAQNRHRVYADVAEGQKATSIAHIFESANWYEREVYDMFGLIFENHPNMTRILMPEDSEWHPLRRKFFDPSTMPPPEAPAKEEANG